MSKLSEMQGEGTVEACFQFWEAELEKPRDALTPYWESQRSRFLKMVKPDAEQCRLARLEAMAPQTTGMDLQKARERAEAFLQDQTPCISFVDGVASPRGLKTQREKSKENK